MPAEDFPQQGSPHAPRRQRGAAPDARPPVPPLRIQSSHASPDVVLVRAAGEIDLHTADLLEAEMEQALRGEPVRVVVDFEEVGFVDSSGLRVLLTLERRFREAECELVLVTGHPGVLSLLHITGLDTMLTVSSPPAESVLPRT